MKHSAIWDVVVVGGGHAGVEASLISKHLGCSVLVVTMDVAALGRMSCNPAIGGLAKGQIVREIDVLGGKMATFADQTGIQFKTLNKTKGRAVARPFFVYLGYRSQGTQIWSRREYGKLGGMTRPILKSPACDSTTCEPVSGGILQYPANRSPHHVSSLIMST